MVINIPLQINEAYIEEKLAKEYQEKVLAEVHKRVDAELLKYAKQSGRYTWGNSTAGDAVIILSVSEIDKKLDEMKSEIIEETAERLAARLVKTKAAKELSIKKEGTKE